MRDIDGDRTSGRPRRWPAVLQMRNRVFLQRRMTVVAILFPSVLTAHALFHMNTDPMRVLKLNPPALPLRPSQPNFFCLKARKRICMELLCVKAVVNRVGSEKCLT